MRMLVVEDDGAVNKLFKAYLAPYGQCDTVFNGTEAIQAFESAWAESRPYDLICMDIIMPHTDGNEALAHIRNKEAQYGLCGSDRVDVIMTTALDDAENRSQAIHKWGASSYLVKPIRKTELLQELDNLGLLTSGMVRD